MLQKIMPPMKRCITAWAADANEAQFMCVKAFEEKNDIARCII